MTYYQYHFQPLSSLKYPPFASEVDISFWIIDIDPKPPLQPRKTRLPVQTSPFSTLLLPTMSWVRKYLELTLAHFVYLVLFTFLLLYALFSAVIRNRLHLAEPPLATLVGIAFGPQGAKFFSPLEWFPDDITQEIARIVVGLECFTVGVHLPKAYFSRHWKSVVMMLGPIMTVSWIITAGLVYAVLQTKFVTALIIGACLAPTDPVLAASILTECTFSKKVPRRLKDLLSAESACNDGAGFPFLYIGILFLIEQTSSGAITEWVIGTVLWQCTLGIFIGLTIGYSFYRILRFVEYRAYISPASFVVFYFLLAIFSVGIGSTLGVDDFLVAFGAGYGFAEDSWFSKKTRKTHLRGILDLLLNSSIFVYFGVIIPWDLFNPTEFTPTITSGRLIGLLILILLFRRIPIVLAMKHFIPDIRTYREALFCGHFGPMGVAAIFLAIEARAMLENGTSIPDAHPPAKNENKEAIETIWPVVCFMVLGSIVVHGLSVAMISVGDHFTRREGERAPLIGGQYEGYNGMVYERGEGESETSASEDGTANARDDL